MNNLEKLERVLREDEEVDKIKSEFKSAITKAAKRPVKIDGFVYEPRPKEFSVLYDTPREYRHPQDYGKEDASDFPGYAEWEKAESAIDDVLGAFKKKYKGYQFGAAGAVSGPGIERF